MREDVDALAATDATTVALPDALVGLTATHATFDTAVHVHPVDVVTVTCVPPPAAGSEADVPDSA